MPTAEIIAIGTELLLGEIQDTNTRYLARHLRDAGVDIYRTSIVGDNAERIALAIREALLRTNIIITTGGLGPTVDDPTRQAVATAFEVEPEFHPELWEQIQNRFQRFNRVPTENNRRQAFIPKGSIPVENPVGTAPAFIVESGECCVISLPGVPREMEYLLENSVMPYLKARYALKGLIKALVLHTAGIGESQVDDLVGDLEINRNPTVGLLAHPGQVDVRITVKADSEPEADQLIKATEATIRARLGSAIYGIDQETLEQVTLRCLSQRGWKAVFVESGLGGELLARLGKDFPAEQVWVLPAGLDEPELKRCMLERMQSTHSQIALGVALQTGPERQHLILYLTGETTGNRQAAFSYGGPPAHGALWAVNASLDFLRRSLD